MRPPQTLNINSRISCAPGTQPTSWMVWIRPVSMPGLRKSVSSAIAWCEKPTESPKDSESFIW
jgi:hypothetical protein